MYPPAGQYPHLFQEVTWPWGPTRARFVLLDQAPPGELIANVNIVPHSGENWVMIKLADGSWEIPGGSLEEDESFIDAIHRELKEEAGAELISYQLLGAWECFSLEEKPFRPHLPFPQYYRLVLTGTIQIVKLPENPPGAETVILVEAVPLAVAMKRFSDQGRPDLVELYQLASNLPSNT